MDASEYISERVGGLREDADELLDVREDVTNDFEPWSALKLVLHASVIDMYSRVHEGRTDDIFYIDALAGSGVSTYEDGRCFVGSPLLACRETQTPFTKMFFIEGCEEKASALEDRLEYAFNLPQYTKPEKWEVYHANVNEEIDGIVDEIYDLSSGTFNYYCFIDNQGLDAEWGLIEEITPKPYGDLLINIPIAHGIGRNLGDSAVNKFYGQETGDLSTRKEALRRYSAQICEQNREIQASTTVDGGVGSFEYELLYATRKIEGGNGYVERIRAVRNFVESTDGEAVRNMLEVIDGGQFSLGEWIPDSDVDFPDSDDGDDSQTGLDEFSD